MNPEPSCPSRQDPPHTTINISKTPDPNPSQPQNYCPICTDDDPENEYLTPLPCQHTFCSTCLKEYLSIKINANQVLNIPCPQSSCPQTFTDKSLENILDPTIYTKYRDFVLKKIALKGPKQHFCPNPGCSRPFKPNNSKDSTVCSCGTKICNYCNNFYHEGKSCVASLDPDFEIYAKENGIKFCMMCKTIVVRDGGCAQITCSICDYQWCWVCGRNYETVHICTGEWDPVPPSLVLNDGSSLKAYVRRVWNESSLLQIIGLVVVFTLLSPLILLGFLIVLPVGRVEISKRRPIKSFGSVVCALFLGILFWAFVIPALGYYALGFILISPFLLIGMIVSCLKRRRQRRQEGQAQQVERPKKRWQTRNSQNFVYRHQPAEGIN